MGLSHLTFHQQFLRFEEKIRRSSGQPFTSFHDGLSAEWESYKEEIRKEAHRILSVEKWKPSQVGKGQILDQVTTAIEINVPAVGLRNNLVAWDDRYGEARRAHRSLLEAKSDPIACRNFEQWFLDFFQNRLTDAVAFERFRELVGKRYDLVAYLFFLKDWDRFMPIAPQVFDEAFRLLGVDLVTSHHCSWENYSQYNATLLAVQKELREVTEARLIDAHSFCWMLVRLKVPKPPPAPIIPLPVVISELDAFSPPSGKTTPEAKPATVTEAEFEERDAQRRSLGRLAQEIALKSEVERLRNAGHKNPEKVVKPVWDEPARGYDILSCEVDGIPRHIEVKASRKSGKRFSFFLSRNEREKSLSLGNYHFYLVVDARSAKPKVLIAGGSKITESCLAPLTYLASFSARSLV